MSDTDHQLVRATLQGDRNAFESIIRKYERLVFNIIYHYLGGSDQVEDLAQDVFLRVFEKLDTYDPDRPLKAWVGRITANLCIDELRRRKRDRTLNLSDLEIEGQEGLQTLLEKNATGSTVTEEDTRRSLRLLRSAMNGLSPGERMAFVLHELENLGYPEVAQMMGTSQLAVRIRVSRARKKLQLKLEALFDEVKI